MITLDTLDSRSLWVTKDLCNSRSNIRDTNSKSNSCRRTPKELFEESQMVTTNM